MAQTFTYKVRDGQGRLLQGTLDADDQSLVAGRLRQMGYVPVSIETQASGSLNRELRIPGFGPKVKLADQAVFARQFATMVNAGLSLIRSLNILGEQADNPELARVITEVRLDIERGSSLSAALGQHPKIFNRLFLAMVRAGETGGALDVVLLKLASLIERQVELRRRIRSAMTYPIAVLSLVSMIALAMLLFVVPVFKDLYSDLGGTLPFPTRVLLGVSGMVRRFAIILVPGTVGAVVLFRRWKATPVGRAGWDRFKLRVPVLGKLVRKTAMSRFSSTLSVLLRSGVPVLEALEITSQTVDNAVVAQAIIDTQSAVKAGESLSSPLARYPIFPPMVVQMLAVGEETGAVDELLEKVAGFYDDEIEATVDALTSLLEPLMIVVMGLVVGGMVVALYLPMFNVIKLVQ